MTWKLLLVSSISGIFNSPGYFAVLTIIIDTQALAALAIPVRCLAKKQAIWLIYLYRSKNKSNNFISWLCVCCSKLNLSMCVI